LVRGLTPRRRSSGQLNKRSRGQRAGIVLIPADRRGRDLDPGADLALRLVLIAMIVLAGAGAGRGGAGSPVLNSSISRRYS